MTAEETVKRLRDLYPDLSQDGYSESSSAMLEAADTIERLQAELAECRLERDEARAELNVCSIEFGDVRDSFDYYREQATALAIQNKQMRDALAVGETLVHKLEVFGARLGLTDTELRMDKKSVFAKALALSTKPAEEIIQAHRREVIEEEFMLQGYTYCVNDTHVMFSCDEPPEDAYDEGSLVPLYARLSMSKKGR